MAGLQVVWLKRDLRFRDHRPLAEAAKRGPLVVLYVYEPELFNAPEFSAAQLGFINESLRGLDDVLRAHGGFVTYRVGSMPEVLENLHQQTAIAGLWSHRETGNKCTFDRDQRVAAWAAARVVPWREYAQNGVIRRLRSRDGWAKRWDQRMSEPLAPPMNVATFAPIEPEASRTARDLGLGLDRQPDRQHGGENAAHVVLADFLANRGVAYQKGMSSPVSAWHDCSRLSAYLAWGCLSMKQVHQALEHRVAELRDLQAAGQTVDRRWFASLKSFSGRLHWHCHFMQKLEDQPELEFRNLHPAYDGLREDAFSPERYEAWINGRTGYPMVDACMRALQQTGWINFRMRAMLVSFASYHLWLHWRPTALGLAPVFLDFEPGIHFPQFQMQSGTTGINTLRIYSPAKQVLDHDPQGLFIRRFVPELAGVPEKKLAEPQKMTRDEQRAAGCWIGENYPAPIVDHATAYREARERLGSIRRAASTKETAKSIQKKHGSRKRPNDRTSSSSSRRGRAKPTDQPAQDRSADLPLFEGQ